MQQQIRRRQHQHRKHPGGRRPRATRFCASPKGRQAHSHVTCDLCCIQLPFDHVCRIGKVRPMSDDVRHGRKSLHPMSNRSAAQVAAAGAGCSAGIDRIRVAQAHSHRPGRCGAGERCQRACCRIDRPTRSCLCPAAARRPRTTSRTRCRPWTGVGDLRLNAGSHSPVRSATAPRSRARRAQARRRCAGAVGRNLNQIARIAQQTGRVEGLSTGDLRARPRESAAH